MPEITPFYSLKACPIGTLPVPGWECFFGRNDTNMHALTFYVWIVRGNGLTGLIDTGLPLHADDLAKLDKANQKVDELCVYSDVVLLDELLRREGIRPGEIDFVLLTQPITYHSGGLMPQFFPRSKVYISRSGMQELLFDSTGHPPREFYFTEGSWKFLRQLLLEQRLFFVDTPTDVASGIVFETTGGHHPGSAGVRISTSLGTVGILETAFLQENIDAELPIGVAESVHDCRNAIRRYKAECDIVVADHDPALAVRFRG